MSTQNIRTRITTLRFVAGNRWLAPEPSTAEVTACVVEIGQCSPTAPTSRMAELNSWAMEPRRGSIRISL